MSVNLLPRYCWVGLLCLLPVDLGRSADWPTYRGDVGAHRRLRGSAPLAVE